jgi:hypothetical protein
MNEKLKQKHHRESNIEETDGGNEQSALPL